jgi:hypothetical protein
MSTPDNALPARHGADTEQVSKAGLRGDSLEEYSPLQGAPHHTTSSEFGQRTTPLKNAFEERL